MNAMLETMSVVELEELRQEALELMWKKSAEEEETFLYPASVLKEGKTIYFPGYAVCEETSKIYSIKSKGNVGTWTEIKGSMNPSGYRTVSLSTKEGTSSELFHRVIASTCNVPKPRAPSISEVDWNNTPDSVKDLLVANLDVHHINGDKTNNHPSNLEYISGHLNRRHSKNHQAAKRKAA